MTLLIVALSAAGLLASTVHITALRRTPVRVRHVRGWADLSEKRRFTAERTASHAAMHCHRHH